MRRHAGKQHSNEKKAHKRLKRLGKEESVFIGDVRLLCLSCHLHLAHPQRSAGHTLACTGALVGAILWVGGYRMLVTLYFISRSVTELPAQRIFGLVLDFLTLTVAPTRHRLSNTDTTCLRISQSDF